MSYEKPLSYSGISLFKKCPALWADAYILGNRQPSGPAAQRGTMIHEELEKYYLGKTYPSHISILRWWEAELTSLKKFYPDAELALAVDIDWVPTTFDDPMAFIRGKADLAFWDGNVRHIYDWKTGRPYDSHAEQGKTYFALDASNARQADRTVVTMVYLDERTTKSWEYTPEDLDKAIDSLRADAMLIRTAEEYAPTPSMDACKYCHLSWRRGGNCRAAP